MCQHRCQDLNCKPLLTFIITEVFPHNIPGEMLQGYYSYLSKHFGISRSCGQCASWYHEFLSSQVNFYSTAGLSNRFIYFLCFIIIFFSYSSFKSLFNQIRSNHLQTPGTTYKMNVFFSFLESIKCWEKHFQPL